MLPLLLDRLRNEMTRHVAVQTLLIVVNGQDQISLSPILSDMLQLLAGFLRKNQRALRVSRGMEILTATINFIGVYIVAVVSSRHALHTQQSANRRCQRHDS